MRSRTGKYWRGSARSRRWVGHAHTLMLVVFTRANLIRDALFSQAPSSWRVRPGHANPPESRLSPSCCFSPPAFDLAVSPRDNQPEQPLDSLRLQVDESTEASPRKEASLTPGNAALDQGWRVATAETRAGTGYDVQSFPRSATYASPRHRPARGYVAVQTTLRTHACAPTPAPTHMQTRD
jgi:hypothetical protein